MAATAPEEQPPQMPVVRSKTLPVFMPHDIERDGGTLHPPSEDHEHDVGVFQRLELEEERAVNAWHRFRGDGRQTPMPGFWKSFIGLRGNNTINVLFLFVPLAWAAHFTTKEDGSHYFSAWVRFSRTSFRMSGVV